MKRIFKLFSVLLLCLFVFTLVGCGKSSEQFVGESTAEYIASHSELAGSKVIGNLLTDDEKAVLLELQLEDGSTYNLAVVIGRITFTSGGYGYDFTPGSAYRISDNSYDKLSAYIFSNAKKKLSLDVEKINSFMK